MAASVPAAFKSADLHRFAHRAAQLEQYRPIVTYWCEYYILQTLLRKNLHTTDPECATYAASLMDKLEQTKSANATNDAILDDVAAKAYIENFALDTFNRADQAQREGRVTRQTGDTFMAAATFLDLLAIWGEVEAETAKKARFAKFHAARILRACKAGEDPNATNPVVEEEKPTLQGEGDGDEGIQEELQALERQRQNGGLKDGSVYQAPSVESAADEAALPPLPSTVAAPTQPSLPATAEAHDISPIEPSSTQQNPRQGSIGGGYFPTVSNPTAAPQAPDMDMSGTSPSTQVPPPPPSLQQPTSPSAFYNTAAPAQPPSAPSPGDLGISTPSRPTRPPPGHQQPSAAPWLQSPPAHIQNQMPMQTPPAAPAPVPVVPAPVAPQAPLPATNVGGSGGAENYRTDDESTLAAQKHARWAISALNFEDVPTAVRELRAALGRLGAT